MPGATRVSRKNAFHVSGFLNGDEAFFAAKQLVAMFPDETYSPAVENLRTWLDQATLLGDHALVPLPGNTTGRKLTVLDLRNILAEVDRRNV